MRPMGPEVINTQPKSPIQVVAIVKKRLALDASLYTLLQILSLTLFEKMPILQALSQETPPTADPVENNQLNLFSS